MQDHYPLKAKFKTSNQPSNRFRIEDEKECNELPHISKTIFHLDEWIPRLEVRTSCQRQLLSECLTCCRYALAK